MEVREEIWVGIDVGKVQHHACAVDATGKVVFTRRLANGQAEIEALIARAGKAGRRVHWAVDMVSGSAGLLLAVLLAAAAEAAYVPGRLVNRMAGAYTGEGKTDAKDAFTIAETARLRRDLQTITGTDQIVADLQVPGGRSSRRPRLRSAPRGRGRGDFDGRCRAGTGDVVGPADAAPVVGGP